jgi:hypothetical protein
MMRRMSTQCGRPSPLVLMLLFIAGALVALLEPHRGLQDRFAGTRVVAR